MTAACQDYPQLDPARRTLTGDALRLWGDAGERRQGLEAIVTAWGRYDEPGLTRATQRIDGAIVAGLEALGLPRGPVGAVRVEMVGRNWLARKLSDCSLVFNLARGDTVFAPTRGGETIIDGEALAATWERALR